MGAGKKLILFSVLLALWAACELPAAEYAVLETGFRLRAERHETLGAVTRLYLPGGGSVEVNTTGIARFESEEYVPASPANAGSPSLNAIVEASGQKHGVDPDFIHSMIAAESGGNARAVSSKGAAGLMQLMPGTAHKLQVSNVFDAAENVEGGVSYFRQLLAQFGNNIHLALAAYNAGPEKVAAYHGVPPYAETQGYVRRVVNLFNRKKLGQTKEQ